MTKQLAYTQLPLTNDPYQVFTVDVVLDGMPLHARIEIRYLSASDQWTLSIWDNSDSRLLVNQIPLVCSYGFPLDLLFPFRGLRDGKGIGSLFLVRATDNPSSPDPGAENLTEFSLLYGDLLIPPEDAEDG